MYHKTKKIRSREIPGAVETYVSALPHWKYAQQITDAFPQYPLYVWGGAVRAAVLKTVHGVDYPPSDLDLLLDDSKKRLSVKEIKAAFSWPSTVNRFQAVTFFPELDVTIDISRFSSFDHVNGRYHPASLKSIIAQSPLTPSAFGYDPQTRDVYSCRAISAIRAQEIGILNPTRDSPIIVVSHALLQERRFGFKLDPEVVHMIQKVDVQRSIEQLRGYMGLKGTLSSLDYVLNRVLGIQTQGYDAVRSTVTLGEICTL